MLLYRYSCLSTTLLFTFSVLFYNFLFCVHNIIVWCFCGMVKHATPIIVKCLDDWCSGRNRCIQQSRGVVEIIELGHNHHTHADKPVSISLILFVTSREKPGNIQLLRAIYFCYPPMFLEFT